MGGGGDQAAKVSLGPMPYSARITRLRAISARWLMTAPLGRPVVPLVYWICSASSGSTAAASVGAAVGAAAASNASYSSPRAMAGRSGQAEAHDPPKPPPTKHTH